MSTPTQLMFLTLNPSASNAMRMNGSFSGPLAVRISNCLPESLTKIPSGVRSDSVRLRIAQGLKKSNNLSLLLSSMMRVPSKSNSGFNISFLIFMDVV